MGDKLRYLIIGAAMLVGYLFGYSISASTGIEPGYFDAAEVGSYGSVEEAVSTEGLSKEDQDYYDSLTQ